MQDKIAFKTTFILFNMKMKQCLPFFLLFSLLIWGSCRNDESPPIERVPFSIAQPSATDIGNANNASDIFVSFAKVSDETELRAYRIFVTDSDLTVGFDLEMALQLPPARYTDLQPLGHDINVQLPAEATDIAGNLIEEGRLYAIYVMAVAIDNSISFSHALSDAVLITLASTKVHPVSTLNQHFDASGGIVIGPDGAIYVADFGTGAQDGTKILKFTPDGASFTTFADGLLGPTGGAFDSKGNLFWSSYSSSTVHKITPNGVVSHFATVPGPVAIVIDADDNLYVASCDGNDIKKITPDGTLSTFATDPAFNCPNGMVVDLNGNLYTCNFEDGQVFQVDVNGKVTKWATIASGSSVNMTFYDECLYVTGRNAHQVYKIFVEDGTVEVFAGTGDRGDQDDAALLATFSYPNGIALGADSTTLYVNDVLPTSGANPNGVNFNPNSLRKIDLKE